MNDILKIFIVLGIVLFILSGIAVLLFLFGGLSFRGDSIAVIDLAGEISSAGPVSADLVYQMFRDAADDPSVVAVVLRINSGGGGVVETKQISQTLTKLAKIKPVVAYITDVGASGAYYVAVHANRTMADADSLIGSIGVISTYMVYENLLEEKLGINTTVIKSGEYKDMGSPYRQMTPEEQQRMQEIVDTVHEEFLQIIRFKRSISQDSLDKIKTGTIFLGSEAFQLGLLDSLGSFEDALDKARELSKSKDAEPYYVDSSDYYNSDLYYSLGQGIGDSLASKLEISEGDLAFK